MWFSVLKKPLVNVPTLENLHFPISVVLTVKEKSLSDLNILIDENSYTRSFIRLELTLVDSLTDSYFPDSLFHPFVEIADGFFTVSCRDDRNTVQMIHIPFSHYYPPIKGMQLSKSLLKSMFFSQHTVKHLSIWIDRLVDIVPNEVLAHLVF